MVGLLIRTRLLLLRRSMSGQRAVQVVLGVLVGLALAGVTLAVAGSVAGPAVVDVLALVLGVWTVGWLVGPILFGSADGELAPAHFAVLPVRPRALAVGLLGAALVGVGPLVTMVAFVALVVFAVRSGALALLVAVPGALMLLAFVVLLSRVVAAARGRAVRSRAGAVASGLVSAVLLTSTMSFWAISPAVERALSEGFPATLSTIVRVLPSGWMTVAVHAAGRGDLLPALAALVGLAVVDALLVAVWARQLTGQFSARASSGGRVRPTAAAARGFAATPVGAVVVRELRTWRRDTTRITFAVFAVAFGILFAVTPLLGGAPDFLPWTGLLVAGWSAATSANLYGSDGTALWTVLVAPGGERLDVRGRQLAWLALTGPVVVVCAVVFPLLAGTSWAWPWVLGLTSAALGCGAGLVVLVGVRLLVPMRDPARRGSGTAENNTDFVQVMAVLLATAGCLAPTAVVLWLGATTDSPALTWAGAAVGVVTGVLGAWALGGLAVRTLQATGPDLLSLMRSGHRPPRPAADSADSTTDSAAAAMPAPRTTPNGSPQLAPGAAVALGLLVVCWVPLVPQGILPAVLKLSGSDTKSWFLALHLPEPFQWPVMAAMAVLGLVLLGTGLYLARKYDLRPGGPPRTAPVEAERDRVSAP